MLANSVDMLAGTRGHRYFVDKQLKCLKLQSWDSHFNIETGARRPEIYLGMENKPEDILLYRGLEFFFKYLRPKRRIKNILFRECKFASP